MKSLTIRQPWAHCIVHGARGRAPKRLENRTWVPRLDVGERFALHAGKRCDAVVLDHLGELAFGAVVGVARFGGVVRSTVDIVNHPRIDSMVSQLTWYDGGIAWVLYDVVALTEPVLVGGTQGLWSLPGDVERLVVRRLAA